MDSKQLLFHAPKVIKVNAKWLWPTRFLLLCVSFYFIYKTYNAYVTGAFYGTVRYHYLEESPNFFWFMLLMFLVAATAFIWQAFRVKLKT